MARIWQWNWSSHLHKIKSHIEDNKAIRWKKPGSLTSSQRKIALILIKPLLNLSFFYIGYTQDLNNRNLTRAKLWNRQIVSCVFCLFNFFSVICSTSIQNLHIIPQLPNGWPASSCFQHLLPHLSYPQPNQTNLPIMCLIQLQVLFPISWDRNDSLIWKYKMSVG